MLAAARKHKRVVQVGTQRRSTPHLIEARDRIIKEGKLGKIGLVEIYCYYHMRARENPPDTDAARRPRLRDVDRPGADAARTTRSSTRAAGGRSWSTATASSATCASTCSTWSAGCSTSAGPTRISSTGGILVDKDEQGEHHRHADGHVRLRRPAGRLDSTAPGATPPDPKYPWGATFYGDKGTLKASVDELRLHPARQGRRRSTRTSTYELEQYPEDKTEKDLERHVAPAIRGHMQDFLAAHRDARQAGGRHRAGPHLDRGLHPGQPVDEARPHARLGRRRGPRGRRRGSQPPAARGRTARRGCIRSRERSEPTALPGDGERQQEAGLVVLPRRGQGEPGLPERLGECLRLVLVGTLGPDRLAGLEVDRRDRRRGCAPAGARG